MRGFTVVRSRQNIIFFTKKIVKKEKYLNTSPNFLKCGLTSGLHGSVPVHRSYADVINFSFIW